MAGAFILTAITADPVRAAALEAAGVDRIGVDLEHIGKAARQGHVPGARISAHTLDDLAAVAAALRRAAPFVRINPLHPGSAAEIDRAVALGARVVMLPFFTTAHEVAAFVGLVAGRARCVALLETAAALARVRDIAAVPGLSEVMIGLNDLQLSLKLASPFEAVVSDLMEAAARRIRAAGLVLGLGGVARAGDSALPVDPELVYAQHARLGSTAAWLARSFDPPEADAAALAREVARLRARLAFWAAQPAPALEAMRMRLAERLRAMGQGAAP
jgi:2-keto-3-deoxy-L-rhamnonate aldolase RhmA